MRWPTQFLQRNLPITWTATLRADQACRLGDDLFAKAVRSGLRRVMVGVESGSQEMLDRLQKDMKLEQVRDDRRDVHASRRRRDLQLHRRLSRRVRAEHAGDARRSRRSCGDRTRSSRRRSSTTGRIPGNPMAEQSADAGLRVPARPRGSGPTSTTSAAAARGSRREQWQTRRALQVLHAPRLEAGRVALAAARDLAVAVRSRLVRPARSKSCIVDFVRPPQQVS